MSGAPNERFWTSGWAIFFMGSPFLLCAIGLIMSLFLARTECYRRTIDALPNSAWVLQQRRYWGELSFKSRWHQMNMVSGAFLYPEFVVRKGLFDKQEMLEFPADLRREMIVSGWLSIIGFLWLMFAACLLAVTR